MFQPDSLMQTKPTSQGWTTQPANIGSDVAEVSTVHTDSNPPDSTTQQSDVTARHSQAVTHGATSIAGNPFVTENDVTSAELSPVTAMTSSNAEGDDVRTQKDVIKSTQSPPFLTNPSNKLHRCCRCVKNTSPNSKQPTEKIEEMKAALRKELLLNKTRLSAHVRSKTSASDNQRSHVIIGSTLGIAIMFILFGFVACHDFFRFVKCVKSRKAASKP
ncbi:hypothetical protein ACOMHN_067633 [Nucella lapillus]